MSNAHKKTIGKTPETAGKKFAVMMFRDATTGAYGGKVSAPKADFKGFRHEVKLGEAVVTFKKGASRTIVEPKGPVKLGLLSHLSQKSRG